MRGIANAEQAGPVPLPQAVDLHRQQLDLLPILQFLHAIAEERSDLENAFSKRLQPRALCFLKGILTDNESSLEIIAAVDQDQCLAVIDGAQELLWISRLAAQAKPEHIDRNAEFDYFHLSRLARRGVTAVTAHHQV